MIADAVEVTAPGDWVESAACRGMDPELFFADRGSNNREAKAVCAGCEVRAECLEYAVANAERFGVWGGLSEKERRRLRRGRRNAAGIAVSGPTIVRPERTRETCGSWPGIRTHQRMGETKCATCKAFERSRKGMGATRPPAQCGTDSGYARHLSERSEPCDACREARRIAKREWRARKRAEVAS